MTSTCGSDTGSMVTFGGEVEVTVAGGQFTSEVKTKQRRVSFRHTTRRPSDRSDDMYAVGGYSTGRVVVEFHQERRSSKMLEKVLMVSGCDSTRSPAPPSPAGDSHRSTDGLDNPLAVYSKACATSLTCCLQKEASSAVTALHHRCWSARWRPRIVPTKKSDKVQTATQCFLDS